jgi:DNA polymerase-1
LGRKRYFDRESIRPNSQYDGRSQPEREAINMEIQGSAADLMKQAMLNVHRRIAREKLESQMLLTVHDELVFEAPPGELKRLTALVREEMTGAMKFHVPLKVDVAVGKNWLDVDDVA